MSLSREQMQELQRVVMDMRWIQATTLVANGLNDDKRAKAYIKKLAALDEALHDEIMKGQTDG